MAFAAQLRETFAWPAAEPIGPRAVAVAALGMIGPVGVGLVAGRPETGFLIGLGAMLLAGGPSLPAQAQEDRPPPGAAIAPALLAVVIATAIAPLPFRDGWMVALAGLAATLTNYSRPLAIGAIRFLIYLVLSLELIESAGPHRGQAALIFGMGAVWNILIRVLLPRPKLPAAAPSARREPTPAQRRAHWRRIMRTLPGWQFALRIMAGLAAACLLQSLWPAHHFVWIVLTVALLTQRAIEHVPVRTVQRTIGTLFGVALTWALVTTTQAALPLAILICLFGTAAAIARTRNYLAYSVLATPVILLVLDFGKPIPPSLLADRLVATLAGAGITVILNILVDRLMRAAQRGASAAA